ncbi:MAG: nitroreductase family protein [Bacteroidetes bacterium]|nr:nitroreductase family protein [Bacteroidota bacterium]
MASFSELIHFRQSVRKYSNRPVEKEKLLKCVEAARIAPSASNSQPWKFIIVDDLGLKDKVARATYNLIILFNKFTQQAPVMVVIVMEKPRLITQIGVAVKKKEWPLIDIGIAAEHFCLQAEEEGLGTCMIGWFNEKKVKRILNIPFRKTVALLISVGYAVDDYPLRAKIRKDIQHMSVFNHY